MRVKLAIAGVLLALSTPLTVHAQSQGGGLPALADRVTILEAAAASLRAALAAETAARQAALAAEMAARQAADATLQNAVNNISANVTNAINAETTARQAADVALQAAINNQATQLAAQATLIGTLQNQIASKNDSLYVGVGDRATMDNNSPKIVASVNVPAGNYMVSAIVPVFNGDGDDQTGHCALSTGPPLENGYFNNSANAHLRVEGAGDDHFDTAQLPLVGSASFASSATISVSCTGYKWEINHAAIMAHRVGSIQ